MIEFSPLCIGRLNKSEALDLILPLVDSIHLDIMDNTFVKSTAFSTNEINEFKSKKNKHVHIMSKNIEKYLDELKNVDSISFHYEATQKHEYFIDKIKKKNISPGLVIRSETPVSYIAKFLEIVDRVIIMAVPPGFSGQKYIPLTTNKIKELRSINKKIELVVDGGMNEKTMLDVTSLGANSCVVCSVIVKSDNYSKKILNLREMCLKGNRDYLEKKV